MQLSAPPRESLPLLNSVNSVNSVKKIPSSPSLPLTPERGSHAKTQRRKDAKDKKMLGAPCDCLKPFTQLSEPPRESLPLLNSVNSVNSVKNPTPAMHNVS